MHSTIKAIMNIPKIDLIIEIVDARAINISGNSNLSQYFPNKKKIIIALKTDLADLINVKNPSNVYFCNIHEKNFRQKIISELNKIFQPDFKKFKLKNFYKPQFHILIVGLPNVGKSSFIKAL
jgi:ribosome biogenesis GTPase A